MKIITIAWEDSLSTKMFISWYRRTYCVSFNPNVLMLSSLNSYDVLEETYRSFIEKENQGLVFITLGMKKSHPDERIPDFLVEESGMLIRIDRDMKTKRIKVPDSDELILVEWDNYVKQL
jgi:hypothetical protein